MSKYDEAVRIREDAGLSVHIHISTLRAAGDRELADHPKSTAAYARQAVRRWNPRMLTVINEPDLVGVKTCDLARTFRHVYKQVKRENSRVLVPFGEYAPRQVITFADKLKDCHQPRVIADGFSYHAYDFGLGGEVSEWQGTPAHVGYVKSYLKRRSTRRVLGTRRGGALPIYWTEMGYPLKDGTGNGGSARMSRAEGWWSYVFRQADRYDVKVVTLHHMSWETNEHSNWFNTAILGPNGEHTPMYNAIWEARHATS
jgi:hypothetical protein